MGRVIGDHIPPNKYVSSADSAIKQITASLGVTNNTHVPPLGKLRYFYGEESCKLCERVLRAEPD